MRCVVLLLSLRHHAERIACITCGEIIALRAASHTPMLSIERVPQTDSIGRNAILFD
jgi:hypothetical protein